MIFLRSRAPHLFAFAAGILIISSCGGGGGSSSTGSGVGVLGVSINFNVGSAGGQAGNSEVISVKNGAGALVQTQTVTRSITGNGLQLVNFTSLPAGALRFSAALYSGANGAGTVLGVINTTFDGGGASSISTVIGQPLADIVVTPGNVSVAKGSQSQLYAAAQDSAGEYVFEQGAFSWSTSAPSIAGVSSTGLVTGISAGQTNITAALGGVQGSTPVVVTGITQGAWTIMVFMNADNNLDGYSIQNEAQMEQIAQTSTSPTRMVLQWKLSNSAASQSQDVQDHPFPSAGGGPDDTRRYVEVAGGRQLVQDLGQGVDMGSAGTLQSFVNWAVRNYPAQHYALVMWDHGNGWSFRAKNASRGVVRGISYDYDTGHHIDVTQIASAISPNHLDIISFDACQMQMLEVADQLSRVANLMVTSEDVTPDPGYPYNSAFSQFFSTPSADPATLAKGIVDAETVAYSGSSPYAATPVSQSVVSLGSVGSVVSSVNSLASSLLASSTTIGPVLAATRSNLYNFADGDPYYYYDLQALANALSRGAAPASVKSAASAVAQATAGAVIYSRTNGGGGAAHQSNSQGLCIDFSPSGAFSKYSGDYAKLALAQQTKWGQVLASSTVNP